MFNFDYKCTKDKTIRTCKGSDDSAGHSDGHRFRSDGSWPALAGTLLLTHSLTLTLTHSHSLSLTLTHSHSLSLTLTHSHSLSLTLSLTHSLTLPLSHSHSHALTLSQAILLRVDADTAQVIRIRSEGDAATHCGSGGRRLSLVREDCCEHGIRFCPVMCEASHADNYFSHARAVWC